MEEVSYGQMNATAFYEGMTEKDGVSGKWAGHTTCVLHLPMTYFYQDPRVWGDMQNTAASALLRILAWIATKPKLGTQSFGDGYYCAEGKPKTMQIWEPLWRSLTLSKRSIVGYRLWFVVLDPELHVPKGFHELIERNCEARNLHDAYATKRMRRMSGGMAGSGDHETAFARASGILSGGMTSSPEDSICDVRTLVDRVFSVYRGASMPGVSAHAKYSSDMLGANSPHGPLNVLNPGQAFRLHMTGVCSEQRTLANYFDEDEMDNGFYNYKARFPAGVEAFSVMPHYFTPNYLAGSPMPHVAKRRLGPFYNVITRNNEWKRELEVELEQVKAQEDVAMLRCVEEDIMEASDVIAKAYEDMDDMFLSIWRSAPSTVMGTGTLADSFNTSYVEDIVRSRNDFRKLFDANKSHLRSLHAEFEAETARMKEVGCSPGDPILVNGMQFPDAIQALRAEGYDQFMRTFRTSKRVSAATDAARKFLFDVQQKSLWTRQFQSCRNLSPFGNMIVRMTNDFGDALEVETNFQLMHLTLYVVMCSGRYMFGLRPNLFITGEAGVGKSFCVDVVKHITIPGAILNLTHLTTHAFNGSDDISGCSIIMEEVPLEKIGIDKYGNTVPADPYLKNRLTAGISVTLSQDTCKNKKSSGNRKAKMSVALCMVTHILISNDRLPPETSPLMSRFIPFVMRKLENTTTDGEDRTLALDLGNSALDASKENVLMGFKLQNLYLFIWEKAIESGVMPDIDTTTARIVTKWIFDELAKRKVPKPSRRHIGMMIDLCRVVTMYYGVHMEFFSEFGYARRETIRKYNARQRRRQRRQQQHGGGGGGRRRQQQQQQQQRHRQSADEHYVFGSGSDNDINAADDSDADSELGDGSEHDEDNAVADEDLSMDEFDPQLLEGLIKWGVVTQEVVVFVISLLEFLWVPTIRTDIARGAGSLADGTVVDGLWHPDEHKTYFRRDFDETMGSAFSMGAGAPPAPAPAPPVPPAPLPRQAVRNVMRRGAAATDEDRAAVEQWTRELQSGPGQPAAAAGAGAWAAAPPAAAVPPPRRMRAVMPYTSLDYRYIEICGSSRLEVAQRIRRMLQDPPSENDIVSALTSMSNDYIECARKEYVDIQGADGAVVGRELRAIPGAPLEAIRCVIMDDVPVKFAVGGRTRRICIAIDLINQDFGTALRESIREALSHEYQETCEYITAFPYSRVVPMVNATDIDAHMIAYGQGARTRTQTFHNVFDTIKIDRRDGVFREISNKYARTQNEINLLLNASNRKWTDAEKEQIELTQAPRFALRDNLDAVCANRYWEQNGVDINIIGAAFTPMAREYILGLHDFMPELFADSAARMIANYPEDWVKRIDDRRAQMNSMTTQDLPGWTDTVSAASDYIEGVKSTRDRGEDVMHEMLWQHHHTQRNERRRNRSTDFRPCTAEDSHADSAVDSIQNATKKTARAQKPRKRARLPF